jgi:glycosyltransferase involved in cell wall biosynthesis
MKVVNVFFYYDEQMANEEDLPRCYYTTTGWAEALQPKGVENIIITRFHKDDSLQQNNITWHFVKDKLPGSLRAWQLPLQFIRQIRALDADVIHLHSLSLALQTFALRLLLPTKTAIIIQHHGGKSPGKRKRFLYNLLNRVADGFFFTTAAQGQEWFLKKKPWHKILPVMEGATFFNYPERDATVTLHYQDRPIARTITRMIGEPVFLWVGRLDENKDPLTVLAGFELLLAKYPQARLYMIYSGNGLLPQVKEAINHSAVLKNHVHLLGEIAHEKIRAYYNSADYFVLGSHYEGSGYALSEALRCGCVPVITNIPSFTMMTDEGRLGALWQPDDHHAFAAAAVQALQKPLEQEAKACIDFFQQALSFNAIADAALPHYQRVMTARR